MGQPAKVERAMDEFGLIRRFFTRPVEHTALGVGDDAALIDPTPGCQMVAACDMLVEGVHFFADADPRGLGHKALAVNLSDLAAMGATPRQALLGIALPAADAAWLAAFAAGFGELAARLDTDWVGGDTTRGPLNLCVTVLGEVPRGAALLRSGADPGDDVWVSGAPGLAALGLAHLRGECTLAGAARDAALTRLHTPEPRVALGIALRGIASACIDVSDGLLADLGHVLRASGAAAGDSAPLTAELDWVALAAPLRAVLEQGRSDDEACAQTLEYRGAGTGLPPPGEALLQRAVLSGGDDYELLFTAPAASRGAVAALTAQTGVPLACIGRVGEPRREDAPGGDAAPFVTLVDGLVRTPVDTRGYLHFD